MEVQRPEKVAGLVSPDAPQKMLEGSVMGQSLPRISASAHPFMRFKGILEANELMNILCGTQTH